MSGVSLSLALPKRPQLDLSPVRVRGEERVSRPYRFEIEAVNDGSAATLDRIVGERATLEIAVREETMRAHGVIAAAEEIDYAVDGRAILRLELAPRLALFDLDRHFDLYGTGEPVTIRDIVEHQLLGRAAAELGSSAAPVLTADDLAFQLVHDYPRRDHVVQYDETHLAFLSRHLEHLGICYFFDQRPDRERLIFADSRSAFPDTAPPTLAWRPPSGLAACDDAFVFGLRRRTVPPPARVVLRDYNYRLPQVSLLAEEEVDADGQGVRVWYGDHFRTPEEGAFLARVRKEALACRAVVTEGESTFTGLRPGRRVSLADHPVAAFNGPVIVESVQHEASQPRAGLDGTVLAGIGEGTYRNRFQALDASLPYRPRRTTPWPRVHGVLNGHVDAGGAGTRAEIDEQGRYKVRLAMDLGNRADGKASRYTRLAQPYAGPASGMHFPLLKGTEVALTHLNGDPDRPIILGTLPSPVNPSVVSAGSQTHNRVRTASGVSLDLYDGNAPATGGRATAPGPALAGQQQAMGGTCEAGTGTDGSYAKIAVPDDGYYTYLRLGIATGEDPESTALADVDTVTDSDGWLAYSQANEAIYVDGSRYVGVAGDARQAIDTDLDMTVGGASTLAVGTDGNGAVNREHYESTRSVTVGADNALVVGADDSSGRDLTVGGTEIRTVDGAVTRTVAGKQTVTVDSAYGMSTGQAYNLYVGGDYNTYSYSDKTYSYSGYYIEKTSGETTKIYKEKSVSFDITFFISLDWEMAYSQTMFFGAHLALNLALSWKVSLLSLEAPVLKVGAMKTKTDLWKAKVEGFTYYSKTTPAKIEVKGLKIRGG